MPELPIDHAFKIALGHHQAGNFAGAEAIYRSILEKQPTHSDSVHLLGILLFQQGNPQPALEWIDRAIGLDNKIAIYHNNRGQVLEQLGRSKEAATAYEIAIRLDPKYPEPRNNLANVMEREEKLEEAAAGYRQAIELNPNYAEAYTNLGNIYKDRADLDQAIACYRKAIELRPSLALLHSNLLLTLHYHPAYSPAELAAEHRVWRIRHADPLAVHVRPHPNDRQSERRLRVGYVSPDFRGHPIARFMLPLLEHHDRSAFEIFCYSDVLIGDATTDRLKSLAGAWREISKLNDEQLVDAVRSDQIDILVDLAAHTSRHRLLAFARKPAPVQVTYLAYCSTTGLGTMDYRLTDPYLDPPDTDLSHYSEQTIRLPETYWCYLPNTIELAVNALPAARLKYVTFGSLNNFCKVTDATLRTWSALLHRVPHSRLLLHVRAGSHRRRVTEAFRHQGINPSRVTFVGKQSLAKYLATYQQIDIGLDPFPFTGGTTTCDALWMGVPVVTFRGRTAVSRGGYSLLSNLGLPDLVASSETEYVEVAARLAADPARLAELRATLRSRLEASPLMNSLRLAHHIEAAFREMWRRWCAKPAP